MKKRVLDKVFADLNQKVQARQNALASLRAQAYEIEEISNAQREYSKAKFDALAKGDQNDENLTISRSKYENALIKYGYNQNSFDYVPFCKACGDTGYADGKLCDCVKKQYIINLARECDIHKKAPFSFKNCNTDGMKKEQGDALKKLYDFAEKYVAKYPNVTKHILVFMGATGTGKSCLASAMSRKAVLEKGKSALVMSAYEFNNNSLNCHLAPMEDKNRILHDVMTCDFLVIDDLGTEPMLKNVTCEYMQLILDERVRRNVTTIITTNLGELQLKERYGERIFSRLSDAKGSLMRNIPGQDLRLK